jgi:hypothetical protein
MNSAPQVQQADRSRALPPVLADALDVFAGIDAGRITINDMQLRLHQRGWGAPQQASAIAMLRRREWVGVIGSMLVLTEAGRLAIREPRYRPRPKLRARSRLPVGLF